MKKDMMESVGNQMKSDEDKPSTENTSTYDPYQALLSCEMEEVSRRTEVEDQAMFANIGKQIRISIKEILKLKTEKPDKWANEVEKRKNKVLMLTLSLRKLSRVQKIRMKEVRERTAESRQEVDGATLQLQNLLYELSHLQKEVRKCLDFQSADKEIDLVPIDQFYMEAPEHISCPEETIADQHLQRLAQLHWELEQRRGQTQLSDKLMQEKEKVAAIINDQESKLASLAPRINAILEATIPLQKALNLPLDEKREQQRISQLLPSPLYTLWVQVSAYGEACDPFLGVEIRGDVETAKKLILTEDDNKTEASDSEPEMDTQEENIPRKSRGRSEKKVVDPDDGQDASLKQLLALHPLFVVVTIKTKDGNSVLIEFHYALTLRIVTTMCSLNVVQSMKPLVTDILNGENFLNVLNPGDFGLVSPNPANEYLLQKLHLTSLSSEHLQSIGKPYKWAQTLCGLSFMIKEVEEIPQSSELPSNDEEAEEVDEDNSNPLTILPLPSISAVKRVTETLSWKMSAEHMHHTVAAIKRRLQARLSLNHQLSSLELAKCTSAIPVSLEMIPLRFPGKVSSELRSWKPITWSDYEASPSTQALIGCGAVNSTHLTFKAVFERLPVSLEALISISPDYPNSQPLFSLTLIWDDSQTAFTNPHIKQMESEVNVHWSELVTNHSERFQLLSLQLYRLAMCLDVFTEATSVLVDRGAAEKHFHKEKIFFRTARGPDRALPLKYLPKLGVFAQR